MDIALNVCLCACALETCSWHRVCYRIFDMQQNTDVNEGPQRGDGTPTISAEEQQAETVRIILDTLQKSE